MRPVEPVVLAGRGVLIEPLTLDHVEALTKVARDGELWNLRITSVPEPDAVEAYVRGAVEQSDRLPFVVTDTNTDRVVGCTSYYAIDVPLSRIGIGYTWYGASVQRTHVNTATKLALMTHAFETLEAAVMVWHTDNFNYASQRAIERLGAKLDGVLRRDKLRRDGTVRDTYWYSMLAGEWPESKAQLEYLLRRRPTPQH
ncbi:GNAT family N-acetyltransferase [Enemella sp. A6]|uniref:GNAT family N-acetyltransferase n=1 Tax=Enemella sp. A6 TaxID=3440152 RepID=UPI003EBAFBBB